MATVAITLNSACAGGGHLRIGASVDGGAAQVFSYEIDEVRGQLPDETIAAAVLVILRLHLKGMNRTQARASVQAGFTVTV